MNLVKFAKLTLATLATYEVVRTNSPVYLPVGIAKAATVATAVALTRAPDEYIDAAAAVGVLTVANKWLDVNAVTPWGQNIVARAQSRWRTWRGERDARIPAPSRGAWKAAAQAHGEDLGAPAPGRTTFGHTEGNTVPRF